MKILIVVDMQNDFLTGVLKNNEAVKIIGNVERKIKEYCNDGDDIIFTMDLHHEDYMATEEGKNLPVPHCIEGTDGCKIYSPIIGAAVKNISGIFDAEEDRVTIICKNTFGSISLGELIRDRVEKGLRTNNAVTEIELIGVCTDICVISNALLVKAFVPDVPIFVDAACCAGVTPESHETALKAMEACQIHIRDNRKRGQIIKMEILEKCKEREVMGYTNLQSSDVTEICEKLERKGIKLSKKELKELGLEE